VLLAEPELEVLEDVDEVPELKIDELEEPELEEVVLEVVEVLELDELLLVVETDVLDVELDVDELLVELVLNKLAESLYKSIAFVPPHISDELPEHVCVHATDEVSEFPRELPQKHWLPASTPKYVYGPAT
jgi:hypothetical protein